MRMEKKELRAAYREKRKALSQEQIDELSLQIANKCLALDIWQHSNYHLFLPIETKNEVNTEYLLNVLQGKDKNVIISRSNFKDCSMEHYLLTDQTTITTNRYGIPEPDAGGITVDSRQIDVVFTPLLAADIYGNRLGYGKGFYDRFLRDCRPEVVIIGLNFYAPEKFVLASESHDVPLQFLVTPGQVYEF